MIKDLVPGWRNKDGPVDIMIVGQSPSSVGAVINRKPLSESKSGKILWNMLRKAGLEDKTVYITNLVKYPVKEPTQEDIDECKKYLIAEFKQYNPKYILILGKHNSAEFQIPFYNKRGNIFCMPHPMYFFYNQLEIDYAVDFLKKNLT